MYDYACVNPYYGKTFKFGVFFILIGVGLGPLGAQLGSWLPGKCMQPNDVVDGLFGEFWATTTRL